MITSEYPSPFTSPAVATEVPKAALIMSPSTVQAGVAASPETDPQYSWTNPSLTWPLEYLGQPRMTSEYPSPFTSPAEATTRRLLPAALLSPVQLGEAEIPVAEPWKTNARPSSA